MKKLFCSCAVLAVLTAVPAFAGELKLTIANGRATLIAQDVPVRQILAEWARVGETRIVNAEKLGGPPVSLQIVDKPEREVLEIVLRSASGYVASPRAAAAGGASMFESVMIMATSRPPAVTASAPPAFNQRGGFPQPQPQPQPQPVMPVEDEDSDQGNMATVPPPGALPPGVVAMPGQPGVQPQVQPYPGMMQQPGVVQQQPGIVPQQPGFVPQQPGQNPSISTRPGVIPQPQVPGNPYQVPQQPTRRPGGGPGNEGI